MKRPELIRDGAFHLRQRIFKELKKIRYGDKRIRKFSEVKSLSKNLIIFSVEYKTGQLQSFDFFIKDKQELDRNNFTNYVYKETHRNVFIVYLDEPKENIREQILSVIYEKEIGTQNELDFFDYVNKSISIVKKDKEIILIDAFQGTKDDDMHFIDGWIRAKNGRKTKKYAIQIKMSEAGIIKAKAHISPKQPMLLIKYNMNKRPKPGECVRRLVSTIIELQQKNKRIELDL